MQASRSPDEIPGHEQGRRDLTRRSWINWLGMAGTSIVSVAGLAMVVYFLADTTVGTIWPWGGTEPALLTGLLIVLILLGGYLTYQQRVVLTLERQLQLADEKKAEELQRHYERLLGLIDVIKIMGKETDSQSVLDSITQTCFDAFDCQQVSIMLLKDGTHELEVRSTAGEVKEKILGSTQKLGEGIAGRVAREGRPLLLGGDVDKKKFRGLRTKTYKISSSMVAPITLRDDMIGVLSITSRSPGHEYVDKDLQTVLAFAEIVAVCIRHAQQAEWMRETILNLNQALDKRGAGVNRVDAA